MARKKYIRDYRLVETVDERGRIRSHYEYIGRDYLYITGVEALRREKKRVLTVLVLAWAAFAGALIPDFEGLRAMYVALPFVFAAIPLGLLTGTLFGSAPGKEPLLHWQADRLHNRYPYSAMAAAILPAVSLLGELVRLILGRPVNGGDLIFCLCAAILCACSLFAFSRRERFLCREGDERENNE